MRIRWECETMSSMARDMNWRRSSTSINLVDCSLILNQEFTFIADCKHHNVEWWHSSLWIQRIFLDSWSNSSRQIAEILLDINPGIDIPISRQRGTDVETWSRANECAAIYTELVFKTFFRWICIFTGVSGHCDIIVARSGRCWWPALSFVWWWRFHGWLSLKIIKRQLLDWYKHGHAFWHRLWAWDGRWGGNKVTCSDGWEARSEPESLSLSIT